MSAQLIDRPIFVGVSSAAQVIVGNNAQLVKQDASPGEQRWEHWNIEGRPIEGRVTSLDIQIGDCTFTIHVTGGQACSVRFHIEDLSGPGQQQQLKS